MRQEGCFVWEDAVDGNMLIISAWVYNANGLSVRFLKVSLPEGLIDCLPALGCLREATGRSWDGLAGF